VVKARIQGSPREHRAKTSQQWGGAATDSEVGQTPEVGEPYGSSASRCTASPAVSNDERGNGVGERILRCGDGTTPATEGNASKGKEPRSRGGSDDWRCRTTLAIRLKTERTPWSEAGCNKPAGPSEEQTVEAGKYGKGGTCWQGGNCRLRATGSGLTWRKTAEGRSLNKSQERSLDIRPFRRTGGKGRVASGVSS